MVDDEYITYFYVDVENNLLGNLVRGVNNTSIVTHIPGADIIMDLPPVIVIDGGRGYSNPPKVTAVVDTNVYPEPSNPAILQAQMSLDSVLSISVLNSGNYPVTPIIEIEPSVVVNFDLSAINSSTNVINLSLSELETGDLVKFSVVTPGAIPNFVKDGEWYYVAVVQSIPQQVVALYSSCLLYTSDAADE